MVISKWLFRWRTLLKRAGKNVGNEVEDSHASDASEKRQTSISSNLIFAPSYHPHIISKRTKYHV